MANRLNPGDVCVIVDSPCMNEVGRKFVGMECTAVREEYIDPQIRFLVSIVTGCTAIAYGVICKDGEKRVFCGNALRRIKPPEQAGSWGEIEKLTLWNPNKQAVTT